MASRDYYRNMSRRLSRVMDDIGVNEETVTSRRRAHLIAENLITLSNHLSECDLTTYIFGSQTEGTTTDGLESDVDVLIAIEGHNVIQYPNEWIPGKTNLLMIQNDTFPGYCKLQLLKLDGPYPEDVLPIDHRHTFDEAGRVLRIHSHTDGAKVHGPAETVGGEDSLQKDYVRAIRCKTWPNGYKLWSRTRKGTWPKPEMISFMKNSGCFVVQVAHHLDENKSESWRISTSLAERCLMFSLNVTQIRCYTLIKMIVKTFIDPVIPDVISSYICKNLLFHCVENTRPDFWQESNLLRCVNQILLNMLLAVLCMNCPNYFNESINLLLGKVNKDNQVVLMGAIWKVLISEGCFLREIRFDNIYESIHNYDEIIYQREDCSRVEKRKKEHTFNYELSQFRYLDYIVKVQMLREIFKQKGLVSLQETMLRFAIRGPLQYVSATLLFPFLCSHLATLKASEHILHGEMLSSRTSLLYMLSFDSDLTSSLLKYASYLYCTGQFERAISVLAEVFSRFNDGCVVVCACDGRKGVGKSYISMDPSLSIQCLSPSHVSMCVIFSKAERRCCPRELQYEMYRSTEQEIAYERDDWVDLACMNSVYYFDYLSYMTRRLLGLRESSLPFLEHLKKGASPGFVHRETVYNLLGQCYEYDNRFDEAFACYCRSLRVRPTNNAAIWHIVLLIYTVYQNECPKSLN